MTHSQRKNHQRFWRPRVRFWPTFFKKKPSLNFDQSPLSIYLTLIIGGNLAQGAFVDVSQEAGLSYLQWNPPADWIKHSPQTMTGGAAVADYDGDGWIDLYVTRYWEGGILFRNRGDGTFENVTEKTGLTATRYTNGAAWGDIDNDGDPDLYVSVCGEFATPLRYQLYINQGDGTFLEKAMQWNADQEVPNYHSGFSVCFGDYNRDGLLDIHSCQWAVTGPENRSLLLLNEGQTAGFRDATLTAGVELWHNPESIGAPTVTSHAFTSRFSDLDLDGWPDLVVSADYGTSRLFWNQGDGTFEDGTQAAKIGGEENGMGLAIGDYDNDGMPDLFFTSIFESRTPQIPFFGWGTSGNRLYRNLGKRTFADTTDLGGVRNGGWGWAAVFFDFDHDGDLDLTMTNGFESDRLVEETPFHTDPTKLWENQEGIFKDVSLETGIQDSGMGKGMLVWDYDRDGDLDLFLTNSGGQPILYRNDSTTENHWLKIKTMGTYSNRDGIGTRVSIDPGHGRLKQYREISGGSHYLTQSEKIAHFGTGPLTSPVQTLEIDWPSGIRQTLKNISLNQTLKIIEPESPYIAWLSQNFTPSEINQGELTHPDYDPDHDGLSNLIEFGAGLDPKSPSLTPLLSFSSDLNSEQIIVSYQQRNLPRGCRTTLEKSTDLQNWETCDQELKILQERSTEDWGVQKIRAELNTSKPDEKNYLRLRVNITD